MARFNLWTRLRSAFSLCIHASSTVWPGQTNSTAQLFLTVGLFFGICQLGFSLAMAHRLLSIPEETTCWNKYDHKPFDYDRAFGTGSSSSPASPYDYGFWSQVKHLPVTYANLGYAAAADDMKTMISGPVVMKMGLPGRGGGAATIVIALIVNPLLLFFYLIWLARRQTHGYLSNRNAMLNSFCFTALFAFNSASMSVLDTLPNSEATGAYELCWQEDIVMHDLAKLGKRAEWVVVWGILNGILGGLSMAFYFVNCIKAAQMNRNNDDGIVGLQDLGPSSFSSTRNHSRNNNPRSSRNHNHDVERTVGLAPPVPAAQSAAAASTRGLNKQDSLVSREPKTKSKTVKTAKTARNERNGDLGVRQRSEERESEAEIVNPFTCPENVIQDDDDDEDVEVGRSQGGRA